MTSRREACYHTIVPTHVRCALLELISYNFNSTRVSQRDESPPEGGLFVEGSRMLYRCTKGHVVEAEPPGHRSWFGGDPYCRYVRYSCEDNDCTKNCQGEHMGNWCHLPVVPC